MALGIGQSNTDLARTPRVDVGDLARDATARAARELRLGQEDGAAKRGGAAAFFNRKEDPANQRAVNAQGAALNTIDKGVKNARRIVPDVEDILDLARERFTQSREARQAALEAEREQARQRPEQSARPAPAPEVSRFFGQKAEGPTTLGLPSNPVGNETPVVKFTGAQPKPAFELFA